MNDGKTKKLSPNGLSWKTLEDFCPPGGGWSFHKILGSMAELGYALEWAILNSKDYDVPQNRERVFIVGHLGGTSGEKVLSKFRKSEGATIRLNKGNLAQADRIYSPDGVSTVIMGQGGGAGAKTGLYEVSRKIRIANKELPNQRARVYQVDGIVGAITATEHKDPVKVLLDSGEEPLVRKLTPRECFRLQGFTDGQFDKVRPLMSDTQLYKQAGNSVTVPVVEFIGTSILEYIGEENHG